MTDQNQPKLTLEEELDVLEAVYKIGKEKKLDLLGPSQMKRLMDSGRINHNDVDYLKPVETKTSLSIEDVRSIHANVRESVAQILSTIDQHFPEIDFSNVNEESRQEMKNHLFYLMFGKMPQDYAFDLFNSIVGVQK